MVGQHVRRVVPQQHQQQLLLKSKGPPSRWIKLIDQQLGEEHHF